MYNRNEILMKFIGRQQEMREGGENDREMVEGIADILTQVEDPANRKAIAENMVADFKAEGVSYNLQDFLQRAQVEMAKGGQHGGLDRWFAEKWVDVKTGKECGRQKGEKRRSYPACRPSKRVSEDTPKTASELSDSEKEKFKRTKTSSERIPYQHRRRDEGGEMTNDMDYMKEGGNVPTNPELWSRAKAAAKAKYDVYPSAYANGFAAKWYKEHGGGWKKAEYGGYMMPEGGPIVDPSNPVNPALTPEQQKYLAAKYAEADKVKQAAKAGNPNAKLYADQFKQKYNESWTCPSGNCPPITNDVASVSTAPISYTAPAAVAAPVQKNSQPVNKEVMQPMQTLRPGLITTTTATQQPELGYEESEGYTEGEPDGPGAEWVGRTERYIDWDGNSVGYRLPRFRKPGHGGDLIKKGKRRYFHYPSIESRYQAELVPEDGEFAMGGPTEPIKKAGEPVPMKSMYDYAMEQYKFLQNNPEAWKGDPDMTLPDGSLNLCLDCINVDWNNPQDVRDAHRLIEEGYSTGTHYGHDQFVAGLKAAGLSEPVYGAKRPAAQKKYGGCMECGGQMAEGGQMLEDPNTMGQNQQQSGIEAALNEVATMIMNGEDPESVVKEMMGEGVPQETAVQLVQEAMNRLQDDDETEEEDTPMSAEEIDELVSPMQGDEPDGNDYKTGGSIKLDPAKKGTFKAQATRMGMSVQEAATYILKNKEEFSPAMVKKANFAKNFAKELGGEMPEFKNGGGIPARYKKQGFTRVGAKRKSTRPGKKWMVLAKKGDQYKIVHGGYKGMKDYTQHHNNKRRDRFWDRMGGRDSAKARDPFSPLYWHKRFGTWAEGGPFMEGDTVVDQTTQHTVANLENNAWNRGLAAANTLGDPRMMAWALPNKGLLGKVKAAAGLASGLSGAILGYEKLFAGDKTDSKLANTNTGEYGNTADILDKRDQAARRAAMLAQKMPTSTLSPTSGSGLAGMEAQWKDKDVFGPGYLDAGFAFGGELPRADEGGDFREWFIKNAQRPDVMANAANQAKLMEMWRAETGQAAAAPVNTAGPRNTVPPTVTPTPAQTTVQGDPFQENQLFKFTERGDSVGMLAANNALAGFGMLNSVLGEEHRQKEYEQMMRRTGNSDARYKSYNPTNPFGNYTLNAGPASNFGLVANTPVQDFGTRMSGAKYGGQFAEGGEYYVSDKELKMILAMGGEIEFLD